MLVIMYAPQPWGGLGLSAKWTGPRPCGAPRLLPREPCGYYSPGQGNAKGRHRCRKTAGCALGVHRGLAPPWLVMHLLWVLLKGLGVLVQKASVKLVPLPRSCLHINPKWRDSGSRGRGKGVAPPQVQSEPALAPAAAGCSFPPSPPTFLCECMLTG